MKQLLFAIAGSLVAAANARARQIMRAQAEDRVRRNEDYTANAGGWN
jgi:hypothetical protein